MKRISLLIAISALILSACAIADKGDEQARQALLTFFDSLNQGNYKVAATLYDGSYEILISFNPEIDSDDHEALLESACQVNGFQCLTVHDADLKDHMSTDFYVYNVSFNTIEGDLFVLGPCCGENLSTPPSHYFEYQVSRDDDGKFRVLDLPVYVP